MSWKCPCGDVNHDDKGLCGGCGTEIPNESFDRSKTEELVSQSLTRGGVPDQPTKIEPKSEVNWKKLFGIIVEILGWFRFSC